MKPERDTLDEYFEYEAEEFLVNLALLITEGRTPENSIKGRTEGFHCPPTQSSQPATSKHECSEKLVQCRQARGTRTEVSLLWKKHIPIMIEVMLLPDCCYSDEGPATEGGDLNDPATKQDALLLERWILEPIPRLTGDRFMEEKTLLLAVRSFVFFSQLSAWLSVSHGAIPRNILYRVSAAHVDLQWTFSQAPTEHFFPVPNVSHHVALKVSVQSLPRQSNYPVLTCSVHTNLGFYGRGLEDNSTRHHQHRNPVTTEPGGSASPSPRACSKLLWGEGAHHGSEFSAAARSLKLYPSARPSSESRASEPKIQCCPAALDHRKLPEEPPERTLKPFCFAGSSSRSGSPSRPLLGESLPLIGCLLQERHEVIARIAQHLIHCDPTAAAQVSGRPFSPSESDLVNSKVVRGTYEEGSLPKKGGEFSTAFTAGSDLPSPGNPSVGKAPPRAEAPVSESSLLTNRCSCQTREEAKPLLSSLLRERQEVIGRIAQHLLHCDPPLPRIEYPVLNVLEGSPVNPKALHDPLEADGLLAKCQGTPSGSFPSSRPSSPSDTGPKARCETPATTLSPFGGEAESKLLPNAHVRRKLLLAEPSNVTPNPTFQTPPSTPRNKSPFTCLSQSCSKEGYKPDLADKLEPVISDCSCKPSAVKKCVAKHWLRFKAGDELFCPEKLKSRAAASEKNSDGDGSDALNDLQLSQFKTLERMKVTVTQAPGGLHKQEVNGSKNKQPNICEQSSQLTSIENCLHKDLESFKCRNKQNKVKTAHDENEDPAGYDGQRQPLKKPLENGRATVFEQKNAEAAKALLLKPVWHKTNFHHFNGTSSSTKTFHPRTGLALLSSPVPERKTRSGCFDLDTSLLPLKCLSSKSLQRRVSKAHDPDLQEETLWSCSAATAAPPLPSLSLLGNFEESVLNYRLDPLGVVEGFTAEVGASGVFCPTHTTLPVEVSFYSVSEDNAPSPYMGVIALEPLGKRGYRVPPSGTIQVTLFNPNKMVVKMFVVIYDLREMPANHQTFLRQRTFSVPGRREAKRNVYKEAARPAEERLLRYLIHLRFQSSKSGKIYLYRDVRILFSRKSMEVDSGAAYELKSYIESPTNPQFSLRC